MKKIFAITLVCTSLLTFAQEDTKTNFFDDLWQTTTEANATYYGKKEVLQDKQRNTISYKSGNTCKITEFKIRQGNYGHTFIGEKIFSKGFYENGEKWFVEENNKKMEWYRDGTLKSEEISNKDFPIKVKEYDLQGKLKREITTDKKWQLIIKDYKEEIKESKISNDSLTILNKGEISTIDVNQKAEKNIQLFPKFLYKKIRTEYVSDYVTKPINDKIIVEFIIEKDGKVYETRLIKGVGYGLDLQTLKLTKDYFETRPSIFLDKGKPVRVKYMFPINFSIYPE
ncbi:energy transducer TonB [Flavobacterium sp.]|uniref:energy transducer TonB n=1 Tax=Flavobacterium sp. TaxID=239 RepID=UPI00286EA3F4|nr:energy transducer TonB [Flavobacterium sp.]